MYLSAFDLPLHWRDLCIWPPPPFPPLPPLSQTKSVKDLARLSLEAPEYLSVHSEAATPTPLKLTQAYMVVGLGQKMDVLWGFLKSHLTAKTIVFLSTCKQVRLMWNSGGCCFQAGEPGCCMLMAHACIANLQAGALDVNHRDCFGDCLQLVIHGCQLIACSWRVQVDCLQGLFPGW
jgi:ATP-dependent RNA helicase DDX10/DBP4